MEYRLLKIATAFGKAQYWLLWKKRITRLCLTRGQFGHLVGNDQRVSYVAFCNINIIFLYIILQLNLGEM